ncbi:MAG: DEAD/DEAH box helicase [Planctomycetes bacterium]|nr:DEAD/DEAH box helicase [Planctomycetota bacterium]
MPAKTQAAKRRRKTERQARAGKTVRRAKPKRKGRTSPKLSRSKRPENLSLALWQVELRRQFGREQNFELENLTGEPIFSEFRVRNPESGGVYRVAIRGEGLGENFCSCPDFATNDLGTCKHVEFTLERLRRKRGGKRALREGFHPPFSEVFLRYGSQRQVVFRPGIECPPELARLAGEFFSDERMLAGDGFARFPEFLAATETIDHELRVYDDALGFIAGRRDEEHRRKRLDEIFAAGTASAVFDDLLKVPLYEYQREGALFAARAGRCLIGDEMGLGKTIQALAAAEIMARLLGVERVLIVCPTSLKHQWEREIDRFTERTATVVQGPQHERRRAFAARTFYTITNYDTVGRDLQAIGELAPDLVILDEAQRIKNWETRTARSVKRIESPYAIVLTGTPLENRLEELVSIVQFVDRHRLGPTYRFLHEHQERDAKTGRVIGYRDLDHIGRTLAPVLIRRQKREVLEQLPERIDQTVFVPMTPQQSEYHEENAETVARIVQKWRRMGFLREEDQRRLMISLQNMRMSCDSTYLIDRETDFSFKPDEAATLLDELLEQPDARAVVFSQWTRMHELVQRRLEGRSFDHVFFHGGVPGRKRKELVDRFRDDPACRVFLATDAGGVGLNLQHAGVVMNLDLPWNPAVLEQRIGRVHRLGQTRSVQVVNFVARGTIEERMLDVLSFKQSLFAGVLDGGETQVFLGGSRLERFMESVESVTSDSGRPSPAVEDAEPEPAAVTSTETNGRGRKRGDVRSAPPARVAEAADPLAGLLQSGLALLEQFAAVARSTGERGTAGGRRGRRASEPHAAFGGTIQNAADGRSYLTLPLPEPETLDRALGAIGALLESYRSAASASR